MVTLAAAAVFVASFICMRACYAIELTESPRVNLTDQFSIKSFAKEFSVIWASDHHEASSDARTMKLILDRASGTGIKSKHTYMFGFFSSAVKLPANYTAGVVTTFYASNEDEYPHSHDEIDFEFLGVVPGEPYIIQTNVYGNGSTSTGREQRFRLWFDPTADFHHYSILWTPYHIVFFVDNIPIREMRNVAELGAQYPVKPMSILATIWDASDWATDGGRAKTNYSYGPFTAEYSHLILNGCHLRFSSVECVSGASRKTKSFLNTVAPTLSLSQRRLLHIVRLNYMVYDYCRDYKRYPHALPECLRQG